MVCTLLAAGKRVGITATSHKVIGNFLKAVLDAAEIEGVSVLPVQKGDVGEVLDDPRVTRGKDATDVRARLDDGRANVAAGTTWLWASPKMAESVDVLFVDEAGQISLANVVAIARATENLVLLGDPQQLDQPLQGSHPPGADRSALAHVLGDSATMPPTQGLFLESTWRLHPGAVRLHVRGVLRRPARAAAGPRDATTRHAESRPLPARVLHAPADRGRRQRVPGGGGRRRQARPRHRRRQLDVDGSARAWSGP